MSSNSSRLTRAALRRYRHEKAVRFEHADEVPAGAKLCVDVCVIGSGAAGITLAHQLDGSKLSVLLLEAGGAEQDAVSEAEFFAIDHLGYQYGNPLPSRGRWFGGSTNLWVGRMALLDPIDFEQRSWVPNSGWPLTREELWPWVRKGAEVLSVPNFERMTIDYWSSHAAFDRFVRQAGVNLDVFLWADGLYMGPFHRERLAASRNVRVLLDATATELCASESSTAIESVSVLGRGGQRFSVQAKNYVLAAGGLENPRLLLASTRRSQRGVGNERDLVGRYYMDHPRAEGLASVDLSGLGRKQLEWLTMLGDHREPSGRLQFRLLFSDSMQREERLLNHGLHADFAAEIHGSPGYLGAKRLLDRARRRALGDVFEVASDLADVARGAPALVDYALQKVRKVDAPSRMYLIDQMEQEPDPESRVTLDFARRDRWGLPRLQLDWRIGASTYRSQRRMHALFRDILGRFGVRTLKSKLLDDPDFTPSLIEMKHPTGTTRMAASPANGVVDTDCRVHGVENLYVSGSSVFPTVGHANPTLTIAALAARLAFHLRTVSESG